jgi:predicted phage-related endonuclease
MQGVADMACERSLLDKERGNIVSMEIEQGVIAFDQDIANWVAQYKSALEKVKEWQEIADIARSHIENALGDAEVGLWQGREVVRFSTVETTRFDTKKAKEVLPPELVALLVTTSTHRRFTLVAEEK